METKREAHVVVVGGGFAGLAAARELAGKKRVRLTLLDRKNHHLFQPLLYQVATAGLNPSNIAVPIRAQFTHAENVSVRMSRIRGVDLEAKTVSDEQGTIPYDFLILAPGAQHSYFGNPEWEEHAPGLKTLEQATEIRRRILSAFEQAETEEDAARRRALLTFVVVGGGPTGVELAGAIAEIARRVLVKDFRVIDPSKARVLLVEAGPRILTSFPEALSQRVVRDLESLGVEVRTSSRVEAIGADFVRLEGGSIATERAFWAAGVQASELGASLGVPLDRAGRVQVEGDLSLPGHPEVFAVGDFAQVRLPGGGQLPGVAPAAIQTGKAAGRAILASIAGKPRVAFRYRDKGQMATVGRSKAIAQLGRLRLEGRLAWFTWLLVHVFALIGFRNRATVFSEWVWNYVFFKRGARLITSKEWRQHDGSLAEHAGDPYLS